MDQEYFTIPEVADKLKVTRAAIYKWLAQGKLACVYVGSDRRITSEAIEAFIKASTEEARKEDGGRATIEERIEAPEFAAA